MISSLLLLWSSSNSLVLTGCGTTMLCSWGSQPSSLPAGALTAFLVCLLKERGDFVGYQVGKLGQNDWDLVLEWEKVGCNNFKRIGERLLASLWARLYHELKPWEQVLLGRVHQLTLWKGKIFLRTSICNKLGLEGTYLIDVIRGPWKFRFWGQKTLLCFVSALKPS